MRKIFLAILLTWAASAQTPGRALLDKHYAGLGLACELKIPQGMVAHRSADYQASDLDGHTTDRRAELNQIKVLFQEALAVKCVAKILKFSQQGEQISCTVEQELTITKKSGLIPGMKVGSQKRVLEDTWVWQSGSWKLARSKEKSRTIPTW